MKKIVYVFLVGFCILLVSCISGERQRKLAENPETGQKKTEDKSRKEEKEEEKYVEVVDGTGVSRQLKLGVVDGKDVGCNFEGLVFASDYSQVVDGHYYYMRTDGMGNYTVYRDKGEEAVRFIISDEHYIKYFVKYGDVFYAFVREDDFSSGSGDLDNTLVSINDKTGYVTKIKDMTVEVASKEIWRMGRAVFYKDSFYFEDYSDYYSEDYSYDYSPPHYGVLEVGQGRLACLHLDGNMEKERFPLASRMESMKEKPMLTFIDGKIYYGEQQDRTVTLFSYDLGSGVEKEVLCYERPDYN